MTLPHGLEIYMPLSLAYEVIMSSVYAVIQKLESCSTYVSLNISKSSIKYKLTLEIKHQDIVFREPLMR